MNYIMKRGVSLDSCDHIKIRMNAKAQINVGVARKTIEIKNIYIIKVLQDGK